MSGLLPINPADFPDVPTKKALIAIDLQNDFLAEDGALPVRYSDGMIDNIVRLATAVRGSGYGEVVWVRSQFDTNRAVGEEQIMANDTPPSPGSPRELATATTARARTPRRSPQEPTSLEADAEAFLSIVSGQSTGTGTGNPKPQCVRKGTKGVELLPAIAAAKGPRDYTMTKTYYSAFQSGQLLQLLRRHFATELYICGALCNVSVYATALAASSYGFDITIVEDCCCYRSEARHLNAKRKLTELTGCEFAMAADIIPTLRPKPSSMDARSHHPSTPRVNGPTQIPSELLAAALAAKGRSPHSRGSQGIPVRPKSLHSPATPPSNARSTGEEGRGRSRLAALPSSPSPDDLSPQMEKLKLNAAASTGPVNVSVASNETPQPSPAQPSSESTVHSVVKANKAKAGHEESQQRAIAQGRESSFDLGKKQSKDVLIAIEPSKHESQPTYKAEADGLNAGVVDGAVHHSAAIPSPAEGAPTSPRMSDTKPTATLILTEDLLTAETPHHISKGNWPLIQGGTDSKGPRSTQPSGHKTEDSEGEGASERSTDGSKMAKASATKPTTPEPICEGDTTLTYPFLPPSILPGLFERLCTEVHFLKMKHQGGEVPRFVAVQGSVAEDGTHPVYRHPSDETLPCVPFTPAVEAIRREVEKQVGHEMNHVLIQCYRGGNDYISEHSDKTLDIVEGSYIANMSLGAERTMVFRTKRDASRVETKTPENSSAPAEEREDSNNNAGKESQATPNNTDTTSPSKRQTIRIPLPHNSLLQMGLSTNAMWLHGIRPDKRPPSQRSPDELAYNGYRISLTFRHIGTFLTPTDNPDEPLIWGQGAVAKTRSAARPVVNGQTDQAISMLKAFGRENNDSRFRRGESSYATGFDVLHMKSAPRFFGCGDTMVDGRVRVALAELGIKHARGSIGTGGISTTAAAAAGTPAPLVVPVRFEVDDAGQRASVTGDAAVLLYLDARHPRARRGGEAELARVYTRFHAAVALGQRWKELWRGAVVAEGAGAAARRGVIKTFVRDGMGMGMFNTWLRETLRQIGGGAAGGRGGGAGGGGEDGEARTAGKEKGEGEGKSDSETGELFLAGGAAPSIADFAFWPVLQDITEEWRRAEGGFEETWVERGKYTALEKYYVDFSGRKSVVAVFGKGAGALDPWATKQGEGDGEFGDTGREVDGEGVDRSSEEADGTKKSTSREGLDKVGI
ncbi:hypothetical protein VPNG_07742 [Cytospora leucostoma]|uniref:Fe2OG dioxygenase domain-containing protein n=1 Tax=Cytospora leucostoma TaxID=1230097 RepID=A0A423W8E5_9PEZI|nr:hypothetical protein VPNG_07742 [Cytospora leucostoma]